MCVEVIVCYIIVVFLRHGVVSCDPEFYGRRRVVCGNVEFCTSAAIISETMQATRQINIEH